eukprot:GHRR01001152.1.p1 GENE.GHRR01001152.1~~GHRR01001152.1.p1  ORF type:complete len:387 (+),score=133.65 GHRR01001152.1:827-1987(+)
MVLRHTFVVASMADGRQEEAQSYIIDPDFRDSFLLSNATPEYQALYEALPNLFVGTAEQLEPIVLFMASQMQLVFTESVTSCPPWRQPAIMLSKWLPPCWDELLVQEGSTTASDVAGPDFGVNNNSSGGASLADGIASLPASYSHLRITTTLCSNANDVAGGEMGYTPRSSRTPSSRTPYTNRSANMLLSGSLTKPGADVMCQSGGNGGEYANCWGALMQHHTNCIEGSDAAATAVGQFGSWVADPWDLDNGDDDICAADDGAAGIPIRVSVEWSMHSAPAAAGQLPRFDQQQHMQSSKIHVPSKLSKIDIGSVVRPAFGPLSMARVSSDADDTDSFSPDSRVKLQSQSPSAAKLSNGVSAGRRSGYMVKQTSALSAALAAAASVT